MLTAKDKEDIGIEFSKNYISASVLAKRYEVSRTYIYRVLKQVGVDTTKRKYEVVCGAGGAVEAGRGDDLAAGGRVALSVVAGGRRNETDIKVEEV